MPRRKITFDVAINTPSAQREAQRLASIFQSRLNNIQVGTGAGRGGGGGGGGGGGKSGGSFGPFGDKNAGEWLRNTAGFAVSGMFYKFFSDLPKNIAELERMSVANRRAAASFTTLAGGAGKANAMIEAFIQGSGNTADRVTATAEAMRLFNIGMAQDADQMREFTTLSRGMSQALGRPTEYIQEQLSLALANQSMLRFDQLGLSIERHQEITATMTATNQGLSSEMIFQNALLQQASEKYYNLATAQTALATATEIATREIKDQQAILGDMIAMNVAPWAGMLAEMLGAKDFNVRAGSMKGIRDMYEGNANRARNTPISWMEQAGGYLMGGMDYDDIAAARERQGQLGDEGVKASDALLKLMETMAAVSNLGKTIDPKWATTLSEAWDQLRTGSVQTAEEMALLTARIDQTTVSVESTLIPINGLNSSLQNLPSAAAIAGQSIQQLGDALVGASAAMVGRLVKEGMSPDDAISMVGTQAEIEADAIARVGAGALSGDAIRDAADLAMAERDRLAEAEQWIDAQREAASAQKRAASELESAAKKAEDAFLDAADSIVESFDDMLGNVKGLFGTSEVTKEDLRLAELGYPVNYADDALRRLEDVAINKTERGDVDLGAWAQALRLPEGTDPEALAIYARRAWESGELWSNPENIEKFLNVDATKGDLRGQEFAALGQQNLRAFFGLGTEQGNEFLRVFGVEALDPIQDGLITEITTRGPIMGEALANMMHQGFKSQALSLPWVQTLMDVMNSQVGRKLMEDMNNNASGDLADAEAIPVP
jgi:hypothetical protein